MIEKFKIHIKENFSFLENQKLFLAVSGGLDSMVLLHLFAQLDHYFAVLHCNFKLRGKESDGDEKFVYDYCTKREIFCVVGNFQTDFYAKQAKLSTQVAARNLRYEWFDEQLSEKKYDYVLTAHHLDDSLETFIINLSRGTGLDGLTGIPALNKKIVRPLLPFTRQEIENYATINKIKWREDSSNETDKYLRNKIRHNIVPQLKELNDNFLANFYKTQSFLQQAEMLAEDAVDFASGFGFEKVGDDVHFNIANILQLSDYKAYLYRWLKVCGFTAWDDIYDLVYAESGKKVVSKYYQIQKYREFLILSEIKIDKSIEKYLISNSDFIVKLPINLTFSKVADISKGSQDCIFVDDDKLVYPLEIRRALVDDIFYPTQMIGSKKISKYLKDEQLSFTMRARVWLLVDASNAIVWVIGHRQDSRFMHTENTKNITKINYSK